jgi:hypothetical protein
MSIDAEVLNSEPAHLLSSMYATEYPPRSLPRERSPVPSMLNALGACAGFAAQVAVWRELVLPTKRNPGDFFVYAITKSRETFFFGEAINLFLSSMMPDRMSFLSLAATGVSNVSELLDIGELATHVSRTLGTEAFGRPRVPPSVKVPELPRGARTWGKAAGRRTARRFAGLTSPQIERAKRSAVFSSHCSSSCGLGCRCRRRGQRSRRRRDGNRKICPARSALWKPTAWCSGKTNGHDVATAQSICTVGTRRDPLGARLAKAAAL